MKTNSLGAFGVEVTGADLRAPMSADEARALVDLVVENHVAVFRGQHLSKAEYDRFGRNFGTPIDFFFTTDLDEEFPAIIKISNAPALDAGRRNGAAFWHTDGSYEHLPASFTMLLGLEAPAQGGETSFVSLASAFETLSVDEQQRFAALQARHKLMGGKRGPGETPLAPDIDKSDRDDGIRAKKRAAEQPVHPLVITHPISGRKSFYGVAGSPFAIEGMDEDEGERVLDQIKTHVTQDQFLITPKVEAGDVIIWDNLSTLHKATPIEYSDRDGERRALLRLSTQGLPPAYRDRAPVFALSGEARSAKLGREKQA